MPTKGDWPFEEHFEKSVERNRELLERLADRREITTYGLLMKREARVCMCGDCMRGQLRLPETE
jgi:hypothetical protein